jgi:hypothetical protein
MDGDGYRGKDTRPHTTDVPKFVTAFKNFANKDE